MLTHKTHRDPTEATRQHVLAASGNVCAYPACPHSIFDLESATLIGRISHICAKSPGGPRYDPSQPEEENRSFDNLMAMCPIHALIIDGPKWKDYSQELLLKWKRQHESEVIKRLDRQWVQPISETHFKTIDGDRVTLHLWRDSSGTAQAYSPEQMVTIENIKSLVYGGIISKTLELPEIFKLLSMEPDVRLSELLKFCVGGTNIDSWIESGLSKRHSQLSANSELSSK